MKTSMKCVAFMLLATAGLSSCQNEIPNGGNDNVQGEETYMALNIAFPQSAQTRATADENATADETAVKTVDIFIYDAAGIYESVTSFDDSKLGDYFTQGTGTTDNLYTAKTAVKTTTGQKKVFVAFNLPASIKSGLITAGSIKALSEVGQTITTAQISDGTGVNTGKAFVMCNKVITTTAEALEATTITDATDPKFPKKNQVEVTVARLAAKVTVQKAATVAVETELQGDFNMDNLKFGIDNFNQKVFLLQNQEKSGAAFLYKDPNWSLTGWNTKQWDASTFYPDFATGSLTYAAVAANGTTIDKLAALYASENTSEKPVLQGMVTRLVVKAQFKPAKVWKAKAAPTGGKATLDELFEEATPDNYATFFRVIGSDGKLYYTAADPKAEVEKTTFLTLVGAAGDTEYVDGYCYYDLWLNSHSDEATGLYGQSLRNEYYSYTINSIKRLGSDTEELDDPTAPLAVQTALGVTVTIENWSKKDIGVDLQ
ncbi:MAG: Mfa1 family fimbria major subunit [Mediterranea sp.]|jgi:hypothetical protein|nr:Mfa1 family fimbria major subunit [Mediterranea sp.]